MLAVLLAAYTADHDWRTLVRKCSLHRQASSVSQWIVGGEKKGLKCEDIYRMSKKEKC